MAHQDNLDLFRKTVAQYIGFIDNSYHRDGSGRAIFNQQFQEFCVQSAFLGIFVAWESFLESSLSDYALGVSGVSGRSIVKYISPLDRDHSGRMLVGAQKYVDWANHETVVKLASVYLEDGEPFKTNINSISLVLSDLRTIRNACAHMSSSTSSKLDAAACRLLGRRCSNVTVTSLLTEMDPSSQAGDTILDMFLSFLDACAENIAHAR
ncbi:hypothetical protein [Planctopirus hydrillae]|uniref:RiboL-PSP-HEPN domain-containing protein n=1 Tax=Planctopirus hydrillae TaxID=1841610 RepID=A0A1C3E9P6_9PLAN|nr:hypothetical protein [Planctopirus hydrillae]ODA29950.1 hypothetical protein A6X21_06305 [Planctopirus hydrillae]